MPNFTSIEPAIDPNNRITFLLDWELTLKCNLDCSYCPTSDIYGGHDNSTEHPSVEECMRTVDFMLEYVDLYMQHKPPALRHVVLNVYGGESLHHPEIVTILEGVHERYQKYRESWNLAICTTTNAIISPRKLAKIIPLIDEFTVSYHAENTDKHKNQFKDNLLAIRAADKRLKCIVLMHTDTALFEDGQAMIDWLKANNIRHLPRHLDDPTKAKWNYNEKQITWFNSLYQSRTHGQADAIPSGETLNLSDTGRACCGGRQVCQDQNYKERKFYVMDNKFTGWSCSVNWFFLYVKQLSGHLYFNKDCRMNFAGEVGVIGNLSDTASVINELKNYLDTGTMPVIQCKKYNCICGLCAPKAETRELYDKIITKYQRNYT